MDRESRHVFPHTSLARLGRFEVIEAWAAERMGAPARGLGPTETRERLPRLSGLRYNVEATGSPHGGRFDFHLRHLRDTEVIERLARADRFVDRAGESARRSTATPARSARRPDERRSAPRG